MPPEPIMAPASDEGFVVDGRIAHRSQGYNRRKDHPRGWP